MLTKANECLAITLRSLKQFDKINQIFVYSQREYSDKFGYPPSLVYHVCTHEESVDHFLSTFILERNSGLSGHLTLLLLGLSACSVFNVQ